MPHIIAIEYSESQRRQLKSELDRLEKSGWPLSGKYDAETFGTWQKLFENAIAPGLFTQRETLVVENAETLGDFPESLASLIEPDTADTVIILVFSTDTKTLKHIAKSITLIKPEAQIPPWKRQAWLVSLAKEQGFAISPDAAQLLAESIDSQEELRSEILKLGIYADGREITLEDAENLSFDEGGRAMMTFIDGVCANKAPDVARAITHLRDEPVLPLIAAITNRLRPALIISCFQGNDTNEALKAVGFDPAKKNYAINKARSALKIYGPERIKIFMTQSARLSLLEKTSRAEGWQGFETIIWELMSKI
ncbi:MAG: hypothetical protein IJG51_12505 [Synergistaceae bacterium]|nr:hypothetical protein [Synergistaceae bacterium]MBQ3399703.1 hypothetical protein [Synergistaceae bacterium]